MTPQPGSGPAEVSRSAPDRLAALRSGWASLGDSTRERCCLAGVIACALAWCGLRFVALSRSPPGFFMDEALGALHLQCMAQTGHSAHGEPWPLFTAGYTGGFYTPAFLYSGLLWTRGFGFSIASMRAFAAAYSVATIAGLWLLARELCGQRTAWLCALATALSPWAFQFARIAWDPPLAPAFLVWGVYLFARARGPVLAGCAGVLLSLAMYSYPPLRVQVPLLLLLVLALLGTRPRTLRELALCLAFIGASIPLASKTLDRSLTARSAALSIFDPTWIEQQRGARGPLMFALSQLADNFFEHLRPSYLFISGDRSLRHSTQFIGELGFLDMLALALALAFSASVWRRGALLKLTAADERARVVALAALAAFGLGVLPAALTHEGLPHALRSIGAAPALSLFSGVCLGAAWPRLAALPPLILALALLQSAYFIPRYFNEYPRHAASEFQADLRRAAEHHDARDFARIGRDHSPLQVRYYLIQDFGYDCDSSAPAAAALRRLTAEAWAGSLK